MRSSWVMCSMGATPLRTRRNQRSTLHLRARGPLQNAARGARGSLGARPVNRASAYTATCVDTTGQECASARRCADGHQRPLLTDTGRLHILDQWCRSMAAWGLARLPRASAQTPMPSRATRRITCSEGTSRPQSLCGSAGSCACVASKLCHFAIGVPPRAWRRSGAARAPVGKLEQAGSDR